MHCSFVIHLKNQVSLDGKLVVLKNQITYLSLEMLQSMTVFLLVLTIMKGRWMMELGGGGLFACCSVCLFR